MLPRPEFVKEHSHERTPFYTTFSTFCLYFFFFFWQAGNCLRSVLLPAAAKLRPDQSNKKQSLFLATAARLLHCCQWLQWVFVCQLLGVLAALPTVRDRGAGTGIVSRCNSLLVSLTFQTRRFPVPILNTLAGKRVNCLRSN